MAQNTELQLVTHVAAVGTNRPPNLEKLSAALIAQVLTHHHQTGVWTLKALERRTIRAQVALKVKSVDATGIMLSLKPGDNGTCYDWKLTGPAGYLKSDFVVKYLRLWDGWNGKGIPPAVRDLESAEVKKAVEVPATPAVAPNLEQLIEVVARVQARQEQISKLSQQLAEYDELREPLEIALAEAQANVENLKEQLEELETHRVECDRALVELRAAANRDVAGQQVLELRSLLNTIQE